MATKTAKQPKNKQKLEKKAKTGLIHAIFILDKSGSMLGDQSKTISAFNEYLNDLKNQKDVNYVFTTTLFDTVVTHFDNDIPVAQARLLDTATYRPAGNTALYDAVGTTITNIEHVVSTEDKVLVIIMTDGEENSSREYSRERIFELIQKKQEQGNWTFVFLGCEQNAWLVGQAMGINVNNSYQYNPATRSATMSALSVGTSNFAISSDSSAANFASYTAGAAAGTMVNPVSSPEPPKKRPKTVK